MSISIYAFAINVWCSVLCFMFFEVTMGERRFVLEWNQHHQIIYEELINITTPNSMCDVTIANGDGEECVEVNSMILAACSPLFKSLMQVSGKIFKRSF
jgi:hypothetical protein